jgi:integrase
MSKTPSMMHQIKTIANEHDMRGQSKHEHKVHELKNGATLQEATRVGIFSTSTYNDFIKVNTPLAQYCKANFGIKLLSQIKPEHFSAYWAEKSPDWAYTTQKTYFDHFSRLSEYLQEKGWGRGFITESSRPKIPKGWKSNENRTERALAWTGRDIAKLKSETSKKYKNVITVLAETGIRAIGMQKLELKDIDFKNKTMDVEEKGGRPRTIPLTDIATKALQAQIKDIGLSNPSDRVFGNIKTDNLRRVIRYFNGKHGLPDRSLHSFRHYYAKMNFAKEYAKNRMMNMPMEKAIEMARARVSSLLGHGRAGEQMGRISVTYSYLLGKEAEIIVDFVDRALRNR